MTPPATATAPSRRAATTAGPVTGRAAQRPARPVEPPARQPPLRVVEQPPHRRGRPGLLRRRRVTPILSVALVVGSLLSVVIGHAMLAEGQVRLSAVQSALTAAQDANRQETLSVAQRETPSRIVGEARQRLHMVPPSQVDQLPEVPLNTPLPTPTVGPATTTPPATTTSTAATAATSTAASTTSTTATAATSTSSSTSTSAPGTPAAAPGQ